MAQALEERAVRRNPWTTRFGSWVRSYGVTRLTRELRTTPPAAYQWITGRTQPRPALAIKIVRLSAGALTLEDVYRQRRLRDGNAPRDGG